MRKACPVCDGSGYTREKSHWGVPEDRKCYYCYGAGFIPVMTEEVFEDEKEAVTK